MPELLKEAAKRAATKTSTATRTATATKTSTEAYTQGNITVTGGAGAGKTEVHIATPGGALPGEGKGSESAIKKAAERRKKATR